ncbi:MAG TPA: alpha-amylase family glycosyl hydrolase, partial [Steroidobacteraceae bacterium]|nr:alpha-amylase family glycosyl hydrolase [Steroidobacteraceae bacterium]
MQLEQGTLPLATYRLQFNRAFGFADAAAIAPYLAKLGITHVYASPYLMARAGSQHGYDIVAHDRLNPELGDWNSFVAMTDAFKRHGLKQILDFVPNHMGVGGADNPLWLDVLEWGVESRYARWFDIDWEPDHQYLRGKVLMPFLGDQYGIELERGKLVLKFDAQAGEFAVWAYDVHKLPICPLHYESILGDDDPNLEWIGDDFSALLEWRPQVALRADELKQKLSALVAQDENIQRAVNARVDALNAHHRENDGRHELHALIQKQHWRISDYRVAGDDINYRRFFNINDLAGIRVELPDVFEHVHRYVISLMKDGYIDGLRIDHIDGLIDPAAYLKRLRNTQSTEGVSNHSYLVVEKILSGDEQLRSDWPVHGTTGYDFCNLVLGALIDPLGEIALSQCYAGFTGSHEPFN